MKARPALLGAALGLLVACGGACAGEPPDDGADAPAEGREAPHAPAGDAGPPLSCDGLERTLLAASLDPEGLAAAFGPPERRSRSAQPNLHVAGATDTILTLAWPGLEVVLLKPPGPRTLPVRVEVAEARYLAHPEVGPGTPAAEVVARLGPPGEQSPDALVYDCGLGASQPVTFRLEDGRVARIEVSFYVD